MEATKKLHPLLTIAALSVTVFSAVGVAAVTGLMPHSKGEPATVATAPEAAPPAPAAEPVPAAEPAPVPVVKPVKKQVAKTPAPKHEQVAAAETPAMIPPPPPVAQAPQPPVQRGVVGTVASVRQVEDKGQANGVGAVGGGVAGAVLGHQIDHGNKLVTLIGAAGGALLGNQVEKTARENEHWELTVRFDDGTQQTMRSDAQPFWHQGDRVRLLDGKLQPV